MEEPPGSSVWKRPVRDRDTTSCPLTDSALNPSEPPDIKQIGGSRLRAAVPGPHGPPFADVPGQIAPGNTGAVSVEDALDHLSGVGERGGLVGLSALAGGRR